MTHDQYDLPDWEMESLVLAEQLSASVRLTDDVEPVQLDLPVVEPEPLPPSAYTEEQGACCAKSSTSHHHHRLPAGRRDANCGHAARRAAPDGA